MMPWLAQLLGLAACAIAAAAAADLVEVEGPVESLPPSWSILHPTPRGHSLELYFAVKQRGLAKLESTLLSVSTPSSPDYGKHLTNDELQHLTAPAETNIEAVSNFLLSFGAEPRRATPNGDFVAATVPVEVAERMLSAKYVEVRHTSGKVVARTLGGYRLPAAVASAVDFVAPTIHIPGAQRRPRPGGANSDREVSSNSTAKPGFNTPKNLRQLYSVGTAEGKASSNKQAVTAFLDQDYAQSSLHRFWQMFCKGITCGKGDPKLVGDATTGRPGIESMLDIETITGVAGNVESEFWGFAGRSPDNPENEPFLKWLVQLSATGDDDVPKIFSTSYGEDEASWSLPAAERLNVEFQKAGARGISLLYASGDEGANCKRGRYVPEGPGSSPWVTAVGGTAPTATWPQPGSERAVGLSSGGFSAYWPMPEWQRAAVSAYLAQPGLPDPSAVGYNISGRAYPDISAQAVNYFVWAGGPEPGVAGTSCAAPAASGLFALLNDLRLQNNKSTLGFLNPLIYSYQDAFNDVMEGSSEGCGFGEGGWPAKKGWDAVTGVGTPNYDTLSKVVMRLPGGRGAPGQAAATIVV